MSKASVVGVNTHLMMRCLRPSVLVIAYAVYTVCRCGYFSFQRGDYAVASICLIVAVIGVAMVRAFEKTA